jgi:hypothetical protein
MLPAIDLDDQAFRTAGEVADVSSNRLLSNEFVAVDLTVANAIQSTVSASVRFTRSFRAIRIDL